MNLLRLSTMLAASALAFGQTAPTGWTVNVDAERGTLTVLHPVLGVVMKDVRLSVRTGDALTPVQGWLAPIYLPGRTVVHTDKPRTGWRIDGEGQVLSITSTATDAVLTAKVPAGAGRIVARLLDPAGAPVTWMGTQEVMDGYGGTETRNPSNLPRRNPDVMYLSLGPVASSEFHALFDRRTDTAIDFGPSAVLKLSAEDPNTLDLTLPVTGSAVIRAFPEYFVKTLGVPYYVPFDDSYFTRAPMVWSSWTSYYEAVREEDIVRNTDWLAANLQPYGFEYVQLDDGYDRGPKGEHYWIENWDKKTFPHGPEWLTKYIRSKGLKAGLWLVPNAYAGATQEHPDWYLTSTKGDYIRDYNTPSLDSSNPEALAFVRRMFQKLDDWGFDYYKFDGEHALPKYIPAVDRYKLHDPNGDLLAAYRKRLEAIREVLGPKRFIEGCPAGTPLNGVGYFQSYFAGHDLYNTWLGMYPLFSSINANVFLNHLVVYLMPGEGLELGKPMSLEEVARKRPPVVLETARTREQPLTSFGLTDPEARTLVTYVSLTGVAYPLASVMDELPADRVQLLKSTMPTMPILPVDLFSRGTDMHWDTFKREQGDYYVHNYPEILDLKVNAASGVYDVVALTNWRSGKLSRAVDLESKLGLPAGRYVAFDYWNQKPIGPVQDKLQLEVDPHDTRVILLHPLLAHPQLIGISRHITGAHSVVSQKWDPSSNLLTGSAETVAGDPYAIWVNVPTGIRLVRAKATGNGGRELPLEQSASGTAVMIRFPGQGQPVNWELQFSAR